MLFTRPNQIYLKISKLSYSGYAAFESSLLYHRTHLHLRIKGKSCHVYHVVVFFKLHKHCVLFRRTMHRSDGMGIDLQLHKLNRELALIASVCTLSICKCRHSCWPKEFFSRPLACFFCQLFHVVQKTS